MFELQTFPFTNTSDYVIKFDNQTFVAGGDAAAIVNAGPGSDALAGNDFILGWLRAKVETDELVLVTGISNDQPFDAGPGNDRVIGTVRVDAEDDAAVFANGIASLGDDFDMGPGNDRAIGTVDARVGESADIRGRESA